MCTRRAWRCAGCARCCAVSAAGAPSRHWPRASKPPGVCRRAASGRRATPTCWRRWACPRCRRRRPCRRPRTRAPSCARARSRCWRCRRSRSRWRRPKPLRRRPRARAAGVLRAAWKAVEGGAHRFADDGEAARHRTRRRLKRLRYATELLLPVLPPARTRRALATVSAAREALGDHNDLVVAAGWVDRLDAADPRVAAVRAELARRRHASARGAARRLARLPRHAGFWRRG
ncbi:MAG: CHAD domain-containing protein [Rubrivivax sp.]